MSTYEKEVNVYNPGAVGTGIENASRTATTYVTDLEDGIMVHPEGQGPNDTDTPTGWRIRDVLEMLRSGVSFIKAWVENSVAKVRIGKEDSAHFMIEDGRIAGYGDSLSVYFETGDGGNTVVQTFTGDGETAYFEVYKATAITSVTVDGAEVEATLRSQYLVQLTNVPAADAVVVITYTCSETAPYFTFGGRNAEASVGIGSSTFGKDHSAPGIYAHAEGQANVASGYASHAEGQGNEATNGNAHAEGEGTTASGRNSHAGGEYSEATARGSFAHGYSAKATYPNSAAFGSLNSPANMLFSIGKGSNANGLGVDCDGNVEIGGRLLFGTSYAGKKALLRIEIQTFTAIGINANAAYSASRNISVSGYKPIGILGWEALNNDGNGVNAGWVIPQRNWIGVETIDGEAVDAITFTLWNQHTSAQAVVKYLVKIAYIAEDAI